MEWPLDEHTDSCLRCRGQITLPLDTLVELLLRAASGEPIDRLREAASEMYVLTHDDLWVLAEQEAAMARVETLPPASLACRRRVTVRRPKGR